MNIIEAAELTKTYRRYKKQEGLAGSLRGLIHREYEDKTAVDCFNLTVKSGEFIGLIGPNGAGKTTLIKMLTGIIAPSSGTLDVMGFEPKMLKNEFKEQYAVVMGQKSQLFPELTAEDTLHLFKEIYGIGKEEYRESKEYFTRLFGVSELMNVQVRTLSLGERMKMELIVALLHNPRVLFLDEPTIGLDAVAGKQIRKFLKEINEEKGTTILLTSHYMEDIKALCRRSIVINHGKKIYDGVTGELFDAYQMDRKITLHFEKPIDIDDLSWYGGVIEETPFHKVINVRKERVGEVVHQLMKYEPDDISIEEEEIGNVVERIYREDGIYIEGGKGR